MNSVIGGDGTPSSSTFLLYFNIADVAGPSHLALEWNSSLDCKMGCFLLADHFQQRAARLPLETWNCHASFIHCLQSIHMLPSSNHHQAEFSGCCSISSQITKTQRFPKENNSSAISTDADAFSISLPKKFKGWIANLSQLRTPSV